MLTSRRPGLSASPLWPAGLTLAATLVLGACDGGTPGSGQPVAAIKFCNPLINGDGTKIEIALDIGDPPVRITANSDSCTPAVGQACARIPAGITVPVTLSHEGRTIAESAFRVESGESWILIASVDQLSREPIVDGGRLKPEHTCESVDLYPPISPN